MPKTLLLADDSVTIQKVVSITFANEDVTLVTVDNGDDAVARAREVRPDVILADVVMPGKNGYEVCEAVKTDEALKQVPVVLLTGTFEAFDEDRAQRVGAEGHITKPFEAQALVDRVKELMARPSTVTPTAPPPPPSTATEIPPPAETVLVTTHSGLDELDDTPDPKPAESPPQSPTERLAPEVGALSNARPASGGDTTFDFLEGGFEEDEEDDEEAPEETRAVEAATVLAVDPPPAPPPTEVGDSVAAAPEPEADWADDSGEEATPFGDEQLTQFTAELGEMGEGEDVLEDESVDTGWLSQPDIPPPPPTVPASDAGGFDFEFDGSDAEAPSGRSQTDVVFGGSPPPDLEGETILSPAAADAFDVSSGDLDEPMLATTDAGDDDGFAFDAPPPVPMPTRPDFSASEDDAMFDGGLASAGDPLDDSAPDTADVVGEETLRGMVPPVAGEHDRRRESGPALDPLMKQQVHDTLEKIAWEAFGDLAERIVPQLVERVEQIAWEVVPQMAETLIREEIRKLKGEEN